MRGLDARAIAWIRYWYESEDRPALVFQYALLIFDITTILFIVATSFVPPSLTMQIIDVMIGLVILADFIARLLIAPDRTRHLLHPATLADIAAIVSFLAPLAGEGAAFFRILRLLRLLYTYRVVRHLRRKFAVLRRNEDLITAVLNLTVFIFIMTGIVYETQHWSNPEIRNYADALYFTVTALTTTGFGDITLPGTVGRMLSVLIMIFGVTLFFRLAAVLFRPQKVRFPCPACGLQRHDPDAVHCKACGILLNIPDEGWD